MHVCIVLSEYTLSKACCMLQVQVRLIIIHKLWADNLGVC